MKSFIVLVVLLFTGITGFSQETGTIKKLTSKEKKEIERRENNEKLKDFYSLLESKIWIIEATEVKGADGSTFNVNSEMNFVYVTQEKGVVQLSFQELMALGPNNIGGATAEGEITKYDLKEFEDNKQITCIVQVNKKNRGFVRLTINRMANGRA